MEQDLLPTPKKINGGRVDMGTKGRGTGEGGIGEEMGGRRRYKVKGREGEVREASRRPCWPPIRLVGGCPTNCSLGVSLRAPILSPVANT